MSRCSLISRPIGARREHSSREWSARGNPEVRESNTAPGGVQGSGYMVFGIVKL
jgi:hypothetical protein